MLDERRLLVEDVTPRECPRGPYPVALLRVAGEVDLATRSLLAEGLEAIEARTHGAVVLDVTAMTFCDAAGLGLIMAATARAAARGSDLGLISLAPRLAALCSRLWPGPQPVHYPDRATAGAVSAALVPRHDQPGPEPAAEPARIPSDPSDPSAPDVLRATIDDALAALLDLRRPACAVLDGTLEARLRAAAIGGGGTPLDSSCWVTLRTVCAYLAAGSHEDAYLALLHARRYSPDRSAP